MTDVSTPRAEWKAMADAWALPKALMAGTRAMKAAKTAFLPQEPRESNAAYDARLARSVLFNPYKRNVQTLSGHVFSKPPSIDGAENEPFASLIEDVDRDGTPLEEFAQTVFEIGANRGLCHIITDFPKNTGDGSLAAARQLGLRPYLSVLDPEDLIGWRTSEDNGQTVLTQIRYRTWREAEDGDFGADRVEQIRVWEPGLVRVFEKNSKNEWGEVERSQITLTDYIPIATFYANRTGFMTGAPVFDDLAHMNLRWWQSYSDQANILHVARVPILFGKGLDLDDDSQEIGANALIQSSNTDGDLKWVEHTGRAVQAGREDLKDIEERMALMSIETYATKRTGQTATAAAIDADQSMSVGQLMAVNLGQAMTMALQHAGDWIGVPFTGAVEFNTKFGLRSVDPSVLQALQAARLSGDISREQYLEQLLRLRVVEDFDMEVNAAQLEAEMGASLEDDMNDAAA